MCVRARPVHLTDDVGGGLDDGGAGAVSGHALVGHVGHEAAVGVGDVVVHDLEIGTGKQTQK